MRKPTGPGKVKDNLSVPAKSRKMTTALLYNFDIDDATVKPEHEKWLKENAVKPLLGCPGMRLQMKGSASRSGARDYNLNLSERRVEAVRNYFLRQGVAAGQISLSWVGEDEAAAAGEKDGSENELDRAVNVQLIPPPSVGLARFERVDPSNHADGLDDTGPVPWFMVPADGFRRLLFVVNAQGARLVTRNPAVVRLVSPDTNRAVNEVPVQTNRELFKMEGWLPGDTRIEAVDGCGKPVGRLDVTVLPRKEVEVAFHYLRDVNHPNNPLHAGQEDTMLVRVNEVYQRQANITFKKKSAAPLVFKQDLGDPVTEKTIGTDFHVLANRGDPKARINVFFLWEWDDTRFPGDEGAQADAIPGHFVVYEDDISGDIGLNLGHEFGHCLGLAHKDEKNAALKEFLMWPKGAERGGRLNKSEILTAQSKV